MTEKYVEKINKKQKRCRKQGVAAFIALYD